MKTVIRAFFRTLRIVLGPVMLLKERLTRPAGVVREAAAQASVNQQCPGNLLTLIVLHTKNRVKHHPLLLP